MAENQQAYTAMARRYRPKTFSEVVGQEPVAKTLQNAITANRVAHAYLFCGAHGCGKTTMARIFACALVCEKGLSIEPCGQCEICQDVMRGTDMDVQEIDGASNNGVEQVRDLREQASYIPTRARYKIYIIDEVHMLSVAAFNALLKTLEEPPPHVKFILATTDPHKILATILSRCQRFDFRLVPPIKLCAYLKDLTTRENAEITDDALSAIAAFSGGSVRDSLVSLDQLLSYSAGKITREDVERVRGVAGAEIVAGLFENIVAKNLSVALQIIDSVAQNGTNCGDFLDQLIEFGRDLMQVIVTKNSEQISAYGPALDCIKKLANAVKLDQALLMLEIFSEARIRVRSRALANPLVALEIAVARLAGMDNLEPLSDLINKLEAHAHNSTPSTSTRIASPTIPAPITPISPIKTSPPITTTANPTPPQNITPLNSPSFTQTSLPELWQKIIAETAPADRALLSDVYIENIENDTVYLSLPGGGSFIYEGLEDPMRKKRLAATAGAILGRDVKILLKVRAAVTTNPAQTIRQKHHEIANNPRIKTLLHEFGGTIQDIIIE